MKRPWAWGAIPFSVTLVLDGITKVLAEAHLTKGPIYLGADWLALRLAYNTGVAFSAFENLPYWLLGLGALILLVAVIWSLRGMAQTRMGAAALGLVASGGFGNAVDRLLDGRVTDMISVWIWPVFNVADIAISVGVGLLLLSSKKAKEPAPAGLAEGDAS